MVRENTDDTMKFEVESRLDDLFGESEKSHDNFLEPEAFNDHEEGIEMNEVHPLEELKSTVLSIDWEITDEVMGRFVDQVEGLKKQFKDNKINLLFLQLLGSVGVYIRTNQGKADPDAFKMLGSAFKTFDTVVSSDSMPVSEKKKMLSVELEKFKELKNKITSKRSAESTPVKKEPPPRVKQQPEAPKPEAPVIPKKEEHIELVIEADREEKLNEDIREIILNPVEDNKDAYSQEIIAEVLKEMKKFIRGEFDDLREELRLRKKRR